MATPQEPAFRRYRWVRCTSCLKHAKVGYPINATMSRCCGKPQRTAAWRGWRYATELRAALAQAEDEDRRRRSVTLG